MANIEGRSLGPGASLFSDHFVVDGVRFPRRPPPTGIRLDPIPGRALPIGWSSQLETPPDDDPLSDAVPSEREVFTYISAGMARILRRIASVRTGSGAHRGFVLLFGPTGCGKTTTAKTYAWLARHPMTEVSFSGDTSLTDFYRSIEVVREESGGQSTVTVPGPAVEAMLRGRTLLINEINMVPADVLVVFSQAMDTGRLVISGTERGNVEIDVHRDFGIIGTANPNYVGTLDIGRAMERRFGRGVGFIEMTFIPPDEEAAAIVAEFAAQSPFREFSIGLDPVVAARLTALAARLRDDEQIGGVMINRLSTRALIHWAGIAAIDGDSLANVAERAMFTTLQAEARTRAMALTREMLADVRIVGGDRLAAVRVEWPGLDAASIDTRAIRRPRRAIRHRVGGPTTLHAIRFRSLLPDGTRVLVGEPFHVVDDRRVGLGLRVRAHDSAGALIRDRDRLAEIESKVRHEYDVNVATRIGRVPHVAEILPCLTASSTRALRLAEAAIVMGRPVFLAGPTGSGKSSLARTLAYIRGKRLVEFSLTGETAKGDLTASRRLHGGVTRWTVQAFLEALGNGDAVLVNDFNVAYPDVHSLMNGLFDKGASLTLPDGSRHTVHEDAWVIATGALEGQGVKPMNEAVENRFGAVIAIDYPPADEEIAILAFVSPGLANSRALPNCVRLVAYCRDISSGRVDTATIVGLTRASQEALRQAARGAALSTAELVAIARISATDDEFVARVRNGVLEGASPTARRVLEPVLLQYGLA